jgi:hypothetical protein
MGNQPGMAIFHVPQRFSRKWVEEKVPRMDSTEFHAMFHEAATRGWDEEELRQLARMWSWRSSGRRGTVVDIGTGTPAAETPDRAISAAD